LRKERYKQSPDRVLEKNRRWYKNNKKQILAQKQKYYSQAKADFYFRNQLRRAQKLLATPAWVNLEAIQAVYTEAYRRSREKEDFSYHVDHIVPLKHSLVCGLHVPWNLRIVPAEENLSKGNKLLPELIYA